RHSLGHGIGKRVHQAPKIGPRNRNRLKAGQVITIEPGIYIDGWGGMRVEDMVLVTKKGCKLLTNISKKLSLS
ncbi:MAG: M24 family metallopeptidase, partial [Candidatus Margulisbacteria bacterium]|nr:M24 family metallopeptidase [Candidatus Margulisiibacteriota bacterium]